MTDPAVQQQLGALRSAYPTPEVVTEQLALELDALHDTIRAAQGHWQSVLPGREWTPAQEAEHVVMVNESTGKVVRLLLSDRPLQAAPEQPGVYRDGQRVAPPGTVPGGQAAAEALLERSAAARPLLIVQAQANPERTFYHPFMGHLDALDWLRMAAWHTRHHRKAIQRGLQALQE